MTETIAIIIRLFLVKFKRICQIRVFLITEMSKKYIFNVFYILNTKNTGYPYKGKQLERHFFSLPMYQHIKEN